jgi:hypothetical protein
MPWVGFEPPISAFERAKTVHALDGAVTVIGRSLITRPIIQFIAWSSKALAVFVTRYKILWILARDIRSHFAPPEVSTRILSLRISRSVQSLHIWSQLILSCLSIVVMDQFAARISIITVRWLRVLIRYYIQHWDAGFIYNRTEVFSFVFIFCLIFTSNICKQQTA